MLWHHRHLTTLCGLQERLGLELTSLIEDPQSASVRMITAEAHAMLASGTDIGPASPSEAWSTWIAPSPVSVKLRLFCLPYAGGVSENVFARYEVRQCKLRQSVSMQGVAPAARCTVVSMCKMWCHGAQVGNDAAGEHPSVPRRAAGARAAAERCAHQ